MLAYGVKWWNRRTLALMADEPLDFTDSATDLLAAAEAGQPVAVWSSREIEGLADVQAVAGGPLVRIEDGFVRSPGLGAHFSPGYSAIFDRTGIYYDARGPSDLERLLAGCPFDQPLRDRAADLIGRLKALAVSKYAVGKGAAPASPAGRDRVLVVGQVEDDASIRFGGADIRTNLGLLEATRAAEPRAWIAFKPHPDVIRAGRPGRVPTAEARRFADAVWPDVTIAAALDWAERVHTITSLAGFEALLRGGEPHVHGRPFYAGWGLTRDHAEQPARRGRRLTLEELVAATLLLYPRYLDPFTEQRIEAEGLLDRFEAGWTDPLVGRPAWHRLAALAKRRLGPLRQFL